MSNFKTVITAAVVATSFGFAGAASAAPTTYTFGAVTFTKLLANASNVIAKANVDTLGLESFLSTLETNHSVASFLSGIGLAFRGAAYTLAASPRFSITATDKHQDVVKFTATSASLTFTPPPGVHTGGVSFVVVPGPVAGAGLPALFGLAGVAAFVALRRKSAKAA